MSLFLVLQTCSTFGHIFWLRRVPESAAVLPYQPSEMNVSCSFLISPLCHEFRLSLSRFQSPCLSPSTSSIRYQPSPASITTPADLFLRTFLFLLSMSLSIRSVLHVRGHRSQQPQTFPVQLANLRSPLCSYSFRPQKLVGHTYFLPSIYARYSRDTSRHLENVEIRNNPQSSSPVLFRLKSTAFYWRSLAYCLTSLGLAIWIVLVISNLGPFQFPQTSSNRKSKSRPLERSVHSLSGTSCPSSWADVSRIPPSPSIRFVLRAIGLEDQADDFFL